MLRSLAVPLSNSQFLNALINGIRFHGYPMVVLYLVHQTVQVYGFILWFSYAHVL